MSTNMYVRQVPGMTGTRFHGCMTVSAAECAGAEETSQDAQQSHSCPTVREESIVAFGVQSRTH